MRRISPDESRKFHDTRQEPCRLLFMLNQSVQEKMKFLKEKNFISCAINLLRANEPMSVLFFFFSVTAGSLRLTPGFCRVAYIARCSVDIL